MENTTRHKATPCPMCKQKLDASTRFGDDYKPKPGDITICIMCGAILTYEYDLEIRLATLMEINCLDLEETRRLKVYSRAIQLLKEMN